MRYLLFITALLYAVSSSYSQTSAWEPMNRGLGHTLVYNLAIDRVDSLRMFCGTDAGQVYESVDGGFNWEKRSNGLPETYGNERVSGLYQNPYNRDQLYAGYSGRQSAQMLYESSDGGAYWKLINTPAEWKNGGILHLHRTQETPPRLYCGLGWWKGLHRTSDNGATWQTLLTDAAIQTIGVNPGFPSVILVGCSGRRPLLRSSNSGATWENAVEGFNSMNEQTGVRAITFAPNSANVVYIGVTGNGAGLYRSVDSGISWTRLNGTGEISEIAVHPQNENIIYFSAIGTGVMRSTNGGIAWTSVSRGLPTKDVMRVRIAPGYPVCVFAVTLEHGAYRMVDEELEEDLFVR